MRLTWCSLFLGGALICALLAMPDISAAGPLFQANSLDYLVTPFAPSIAAGDFDADGKLDLAMPTAFKGTLLEIARGNGDGTFQPVYDLPGVASGYAAVGDLNGDGVDDIAVAGPQGFSVRFGAPGSGLGPEMVLGDPGQTYIESVSLTDLNGDGRLDLVTGTSDLLVRLATGPGTFGPPVTTPVQVPAGTILEYLTTGDADGDGKPDVLFLANDNPNHTGALGWARGNGDGTFGPTQILDSGEELPYSLFLIDMNGDGHLDAVTYDEYLPGHGNGTFDPPVSLGDGISITGIGDVTGDGKLDFVAAGPSPALDTPGIPFLMYRGNGTGGFELTSSVPLLNFNATAIGDFNRDGFADVALDDELIGNLSIHLSNGDGTFGSERHVTVGNRPSSIALADVTGDGRLDALTSNLADGTITVLEGLGNGFFGSRTDLPVGAGPSRLRVGDLNEDGKPDVVTVGVAGSLSVLLDGAGGLQPAQSRIVSSSLVDVALADMDGDGHLDAVALDPSGACLILRGDGHGGLGSPTSFPTTAHPVALAVGALDDDASPDVAVTCAANSRPETVDVLHGNGSGGLSPKVSFVMGAPEARAITIADVNGDGIPDVVASGPNLIRFLTRPPGGSLSLSPVSVRTSHLRSISVADADGDGVPDLLAASDYATCAWVARGLGGGAFGPSEGYGADHGPSGLAAADLDGDGSLDLVVADGDTNRVSILMGRSDQPVPALASLVSAEATGSGVHIEWLTGANAATVERSENGGAWISLGPVAADPSGRVLFEDRGVKAGSDYAYRLRFARDGQTVYAGLVSVHVPAGASLALAASPNPAQGAFGVSFTLPDARPARLEMYDVSGRRVLSREVGVMGAGTHVVRLEESRGLASGVYWIRLVHPAKTLNARAALVR